MWKGFLPGRVRRQPVPCRFCGAPDHDGHLFWECTFPPLVEIRENPEFHDLMREDKAHWPRCLLWHGWLPMLSGVNGASRWAADASESALTWLKLLLGSTLLGWFLSGVYLMVLMLMRSLRVCLIPPRYSLMVVWCWTRSMVFLLLVLGCLLTSLSSAGAIVGGAMSIAFIPLVLLTLVGLLSLCLVLCRLFRGLSCGERVILALQSADAVHNLGVVRHVGRLLDDCSFSAPLELVTDGDLLILLRRMIDLRGRNTVRVTKVMGHADEGMVSDGRVRELDRLGNNATDGAADLVVEGWVLLLLMPIVIYLVFVVAGILFFLICIGSLLLSLRLLLIMMSLVVLLLIRWSGLLVHCLREGGLFMLSVTWLCFLDLLLSGLVSGLLARLLLLMLMMSLSGHTLLDFRLSGFLFLVLCIGLLMVGILGWVVLPMLSYSFCTSFGPGRGFFLKRLILGIFGLGGATR